MCESHTIYHLCGHVKIKTIVQCANKIEQLIATGFSITCNHQVCDDVSDNVHVFPDICDKCRKTGIIGDVMEIPGVKLEVMKAWEAKRKGMSTPKEDNESDRIKDLEALESITLQDEASTSTPDSASATGSSALESNASSTSSRATAPGLSQLKTRVNALSTRIERLLTKIRAQKPPTIG